MSNLNFRGGRNTLKPVGSEKISNLNERMNRIAELSGKSKPSNHVRNGRGIVPHVLKEVAAANGKTYAILQEKSKYYIREKEGDQYKNLGGHLLNEQSYSSETKAMNQLNLMFREINRINEHKDNIDVYKKKV